jgi:hypothetical protein
MKLDEGKSPTASPGQTVIAVGKLAAQMGRSPVTLWRWRREGWLKTIDIRGRPFVTADALAEFNRRAASGEFANKTPSALNKL